VRNGTSWSEEAKLVASDAAPGDYFGYSVSISGDIVVVGAPGDDGAGTNLGAAYVFVRSGATWSEEAKIFSSDICSNGFGNPVSISGNTIVIGGGTAQCPVANSGAAYVFARNGTNWIEEAKLVASDAAEQDQFGWSLAASGDTAVVGAIGTTQNEGSAYVFEPPWNAPAAATLYCTAGTSASGCVALMSFAGIAGASAPNGFPVSVSSAEGAKVGLFFFGTYGRQANSWGNSTSFQCVVPPVTRCGLLFGTGTPGACNGTFTQDLNSLWCLTCPHPEKNPGAGTLVQAQFWYRDPWNTSNTATSLSDAVEFVVGP
jgi:hypothetical protein